MFSLHWESDVGTNDGFLRTESDVVVIFLGDEGDSSRRLNQGEQEPDLYEQAFEEFDRDITFFGIGPNVESGGTGTTMICNTGGATDYGALRIKKLVNRSGGEYFPLEIEDQEDNCIIGPFGSYLSSISSAIKP